MESTTSYTFPVQTGGIFSFPWHRHQIEGINGFWCLIRKTQIYTVSNERAMQVLHLIMRLVRGANPEQRRDKRVDNTNCHFDVSSISLNFAYSVAKQIYYRLLLVSYCTDTFVMVRARTNIKAMGTFLHLVSNYVILYRITPQHASTYGANMGTIRTIKDMGPV